MRRNDLDPEALRRYYATLTAGSPVAVRPTSDGRGQGLFTTRAVAKDEELFREMALVGMQQADNRAFVLACASCHRFVGALDLHAALLADRACRGDIALSSKTEPYPLPPLPAKAVQLHEREEGYVPCDAGCGEVYCSTACRAADHDACHWLLCTGPIDDVDHPLVRFKTHAVETNDIFLLAARAVGQCISAWRKNGHDVDQATLPFKCFHSLPWWDVVAPGSTDPELRESCQELVRESVGLLREAIVALGHWDDALSAFVTEDFVSHLIGTFEMNNIGIQMRSPIQIYIDSALQAGGKAAVAAETLVGEIQRAAEASPSGAPPGQWEDGEEEGSSSAEEEADAGEPDPRSEAGAKRRRQGGEEGGQASSSDEDNGEGSSQAGPFGYFDGTGLYSLACMMNHSCDPNVKVFYATDGAGSGGARIVAARALACDEELSISYIDNGLELTERQSRLEDYGFTCVCCLCQQEKAAGNRNNNL